MGDTKIAHNIYCAWCNGTGYFLDDNQKKTDVFVIKNGARSISPEATKPVNIAKTAKS